MSSIDCDLPPGLGMAGAGAGVGVTGDWGKCETVKDFNDTETCRKSSATRLKTTRSSSIL
jgi:hypothetical protein